MALTKPFVVEPASEHTYTVVFLHRFPQSTSASNVATKVLSTKRTRNHKTLQEQFPTIRWVFPFAKAGPRPYANLTAEDKAAVGMKPSPSPYITQVLLQEAERAGGLDKVILGGQGENAEFGHEALACFPEIRKDIRDDPDQVSEFLRNTFFAPSWIDPAVHPTLAGYVAMHAEDDGVTRDVASYGVASKIPNNPPKVNTSIVANTPHCIIRGGYKIKTVTWDGRRIDDLAKFLANDLAIYRVTDEAKKPSKEVLTPKDRDQKPSVEKKEELTDAQKYAAQLAKEKKENAALAEKIKMRIEADKVERKIRQARERAARDYRERSPQEKAREERNRSDSPEFDTMSRYMHGPGHTLGGSSQGRSSPTGVKVEQDELPDNWVDGYSDEEDEEAQAEDERAGEEIHERETEPGTVVPPTWNKRRNKRKPGQKVGGNWAPPAGVRGGMSEAQLAALGLNENMKREGDDDAGCEPGIKREKGDEDRLAADN